VPGLESVDTLAIIDDITTTSFVDSSLSLDSSYSYRVSTVNNAGFEAASRSETARPLSPPPIEIRNLTFDSRTATATLTWTRFAGASFSSYRVVRTCGFDTQTFAEINDKNDTSFVDTGLLGVTEYTYSVAIMTLDGGELRSDARSGSFHHLLATWPLPDLAVTARLYIENEESITALVQTQKQTSADVKLLQFDRESGGALDQLAFREAYEALNAHADGFGQGTVTTAVTPEGWRFLSLGWRLLDRGPLELQSRNAHLFAFDPDGNLSWARHELFVDELSDVLNDPRSQVSGEVSIWGGQAASIGHVT
jgi:hypothetical protein